MRWALAWVGYKSCIHAIVNCALSIQSRSITGAKPSLSIPSRMNYVLENFSVAAKIPYDGGWLPHHLTELLKRSGRANATKH